MNETRTSGSSLIAMDSSAFETMPRALISEMQLPASKKWLKVHENRGSTNFDFKITWSWMMYTNSGRAGEFLSPRYGRNGKYIYFFFFKYLI